MQNCFSWKPITSEDVACTNFSKKEKNSYLEYLFHSLHILKIYTNIIIANSNIKTNHAVILLLELYKKLLKLRIY